MIRNGRRLVEPYTQHIARYEDPYRDNFPLSSEPGITERGRDTAGTILGSWGMYLIHG